MTPKKYPQNLHTPKNIHFSETPKILKFKILNPPPPPQKKIYINKNNPSPGLYKNIRGPPLEQAQHTRFTGQKGGAISVN